MQLYVRGPRIVEKSDFAVRLKLALFGRAKLCNQGELEFYAFRCEVHGVVVDYVRGHDPYLECPYCRSG